jgi:hypothetical protein
MKEVILCHAAVKVKAKRAARRNRITGGVGPLHFPASPGFFIVTPFQVFPVYQVLPEY